MDQCMVSVIFQADLLCDMYPGIVACGLEAPMNRFVYELEKKGRQFKKTMKHVALNFEDMQEYDEWRRCQQSITGGKYTWEKADLVLRKWLLECGCYLRKDVIPTYNDGWVQIPMADYNLFVDWRENLASTYADEDDF